MILSPFALSSGLSVKIIISELKGGRDSFPSANSLNLDKRNTQHLADHYAASVSNTLSSPRAKLTRGECLVTTGTGSKTKLDLSHGALGPGKNRYLQC